MSLLSVEHLSVAYGPQAAVKALSFTLERGQSLGLVGESGSGKSQTALALLGLLPASARIEGCVRFDGLDLLRASQTELRQVRGARIGMVFQDPLSSLNPHLRIGTQLAEGLRQHRGLDRAAARAESLRLLDAVRMPDAARRLAQHPHELSGGQRQRVMIAIALSCDPELLIADEPTTALDLTVQAGILDLLVALRRERALALLLITHDLGVVAELCERALVLRHGEAVEEGPTTRLLETPAHPYTRALLAARSRLHAR